MNLRSMNNQRSIKIKETKVRNMQFFDLYWEDIIVSNVIPYLSIADCFNFRCASKTCMKVINMYFTRMKMLKLIDTDFSPQTFEVFTTTCRMLTVLNLSRCASIKDNELIPLLLQNRGLVSLNLSQCWNLSAKCLQPVILYCNNLQTLKLGQCSWLTSGAMEALALHQHRLEDVDLSHCYLISESSILIFVKKFRNIKTLNMQCNRQITDNLLYTLAKYSSQLKLLNLVGCHNISDKGIKAVGMFCKNLEGLLVQGCPVVTEASLKQLRARIHIDRRAPELVPGGTEEDRRKFVARITRHHDHMMAQRHDQNILRNILEALERKK